MRVIVGVDPSTFEPAMAVLAGGQILGAWCLSAPDKSSLEYRAINLCSQVDEAIRPIWSPPDVLVVENQQVVRGWTKRPQDIVALAKVAGAYLALRAKRKYSPFPHEWKGTAKSYGKVVNQSRTYKELGIEFEVYKDYCIPKLGRNFDHITKKQWRDVGDAIGLAVWGSTRP